MMVFGTKSLVIYHSLANSKVRKIGKVLLRAARDTVIGWGIG